MNQKRNHIQVQKSSGLKFGMVFLMLLLNTCQTKSLTKISNFFLNAKDQLNDDFFSSSNLDDFGFSLSAQVNGCKIYDNNANCLYCIRDQYLQNGVCVSIDYANLIQNCNIYVSATECYECDIDFRASADKKSCTSVGVVNGCRKWRDATCLVCGSGFFLSNGNCVSSIPNCSIPLNGNACLECASGFGITDNTLVCRELTTAQSSQNCARFNGDVCTQCRSSFSLDLNTNKCLQSSEVDSQIDENCASTVVSNDQHCNICRHGFYLDIRADGSLFCNTLNARDESCYILDFTVRTNCLVCMPTFEMQGNKCIQVIRDAPQIVDPVASSWIFRNLILLSIGFLMIN